MVSGARSVLGCLETPEPPTEERLDGGRRDDYGRDQIFASGPLCGNEEVGQRSEGVECSQEDG